MFLFDGRGLLHPYNLSRRDVGRGLGGGGDS